MFLWNKHHQDSSLYKELQMVTVVGKKFSLHGWKNYSGWLFPTNGNGWKIFHILFILPTQHYYFLQNPTIFNPKTCSTWFHNYSCSGVGRVNSEEWIIKTMGYYANYQKNISLLRQRIYSYLLPNKFHSILWRRQIPNEHKILD